MDRRSLLTGLVTAIAAPAIVPIKSLMAMPRAPVFVPEAGQLYVEFIKDILERYTVPIKSLVATRVDDEIVAVMMRAHQQAVRDLSRSLMAMPRVDDEIVAVMVREHQQSVAYLTLGHP